MGLLKEVFVDHTLDGEDIPRNILWVGAMNPFVVLKADLGKSRAIDFTGITSSDLVFIVRPPPPSMEELIFDFKKFTPMQEEAFLSVLLTMKYDWRDQRQGVAKGKDPFPGLERKSILEFVLFAQEFVRSAAMERVSLSIRDIHLYVFCYIMTLITCYILCVRWISTTSYDSTQKVRN